MIKKVLKPAKIILYHLSLRFSKLGFKYFDKQPDQQDWDREYSSHKWDYLRDIEQFSRYGVLTQYMDHFKNDGKFLDVGCGDGILYQRYKPYGFSKYTGIDISQVAIDGLNKTADENAFFVQADAEQYESQGKFNVIIFNEIIYYFNDPLKIIKRYAELLEKDGVMILSTSMMDERGKVILNMIKKHYILLDEVKLSHFKKGWLCNVFIPGKK